MFVIVFFFKKQLATDRVGETNDTNPSHSRMRERESRVRLGGKDAGGNFRQSWGEVGVGVQDSTSLHGFRVEEIHLLELIKI